MNRTPCKVRILKLNVMLLAAFFLCLNSITYADASKGLLEVNKTLESLKSKVKVKTLSNGLKVIFYKRGIAPVFASVISIRVGGIDEKLGETGISHMLEHMAFKGTSEIGTLNYSKEKRLLRKVEELARVTNRARDFNEEQKKEWVKLQEELEKLYKTDDFTQIYKARGASGLNATTDKDLTNFFVKFPVSEFEFWAKTEADRLINTVFRQFYKERAVVLEERRMRYDDSPDGLLYEKLLGIAYEKHPYRNPVIGYVDEISGLLSDEVQEFQKKYYVAGNVVIGIVGAIDIEKAMPILEKYFGEVPKGEITDRYNSKTAKLTGERVLTINDDAENKVFIAYHKPNYPNEDDPPLSLFNEAILGSRISPLYKILVEKRKILASISHYEVPGFAYPNLMLYQLVPNSKYSNEEATEAFDKELNKIIKKGVSKEDVEIARRSILTSYVGRLQSNLSLAKDFTNSAQIYGKWSAFLDWQDEVSKVTMEDLNRVAKMYFDKNSRVIAKIRKSK